MSKARDTADVVYDLANGAIGSGGGMLPQSKMLSGSLSLSNVVTNKKTYVGYAYTGDGTSSHAIPTGIESYDMNWVSGVTYSVGDLAFDRTSFVLYECIQAHDSSLQPLADNAYWDIVADNDVKDWYNSRVWIKSRSNTYGHIVTDTLRGVQKFIYTNDTTAESTGSDMLSAFTATGFTIGANPTQNLNLATYIAWQQQYNKVFITTTNHSKKALVAFDDVSNRSMVLYQGSGLAGHEIPHGLSVEPNLSIHKNLITGGTSSYSWLTLHGSDFSDRLDLNTNNTSASITNTGKTQSHIILNDFTSMNDDASSDVYIAYIEANSPNIKVGTYSGTDASGNEVYCGFKPAYVVLKSLSYAGSWGILDNARTNDGYQVYADLTNAESTTDIVNFTSTGFQFLAASQNKLGEEFLFIAYADTNANGNGSLADISTVSSQVQSTGTAISFSSGYTTTGADNTSESIADGTLTITGLV